MALIKCPECGKEISDASTACIHCGYPISKNPDVQEKVKSNIENKEKELHDRIANMILQNIKCYREDVQEYEQEQEDELYIDNTSETVSEHAKVSMKNRSRCLEGGVLDELAKELAQAHYDLKEQEQMLNNMIEKARAQSKNLEFVHGG